MGRERVAARMGRVVLACACGLLAPDAAAQTGSDEIDRAEALLRACRAREAADAFSAILARSAGEERAIAGRIEAWIDADRWVEALDAAHGLGDRGREHGVLASAVGAALYRSGALEEAREVLARHAASGALTPRGLTVLGLIRLAEGGGAEATELMRRALASDPADARLVLRSAEATTTRAEAAERLARYLEIGALDDEDRREGARGTLRGLEALGERQVWRALAAPETIVLRLQPLVGPSGVPAAWTVSARLGPKRRPVRLLVDTGSGGVFLVDRAARRGGFEPLSEETAFGGGGAGKHRSGRGVVPSFALDGLQFLDALVSTTSVELDPQGRYLGVLGPGVLDEYRWVLDLRGGRLTLDHEVTEPVVGVPYWTVAGQILVSAAARGAPPGLFLLDTGATQSVLDFDYLARVPGAQVTDRAPARGYGGTISGVRRVENVQLELLGRASRDPQLLAADLDTRSRLGGVEIAGYIGMDLLDGTVLVIDPRARRVVLREPG